LQLYIEITSFGRGQSWWCLLRKASYFYYYYCKICNFTGLKGQLAKKKIVHILMLAFWPAGTAESPSLHLLISPSLHLLISPSLHLLISPSLHLLISPSLHLLIFTLDNINSLFSLGAYTPFTESLPKNKNSDHRGLKCRQKMLQLCATGRKGNISFNYHETFEAQHERNTFVLASCHERFKYSIFLMEFLLMYCLGNNFLFKMLAVIQIVFIYTLQWSASLDFMVWWVAD